MDGGEVVLQPQEGAFEPEIADSREPEGESERRKREDEVMSRVGLWRQRETEPVKNAAGQKDSEKMKYI